MVSFRQETDADSQQAFRVSLHQANLEKPQYEVIFPSSAKAHIFCIL